MILFVYPSIYDELAVIGHNVLSRYIFTLSPERTQFNCLTASCDTLLISPRDVQYFFTALFDLLWEMMSSVGMKTACQDNIYGELSGDLTVPVTYHELWYPLEHLLYGPELSQPLASAVQRTLDYLKGITRPDHRGYHQHSQILDLNQYKSSSRLERRSHWPDQ
ncbi:uncharacterized protein LAESUDRAFT_729534 [Laetiporus sulphureus 93-53]|uniref:Uncharacterized protein n=1 Tax=Laetiporus sulphureus 93-53 TaxID=1314785 RepID=A0A165CLJ3_9APHY|nr:uncharacterized protein LAESUDRAFT_729534 [Laetiporus sulphureus 93-53]KZT03026.1 hypothetical protein LAESUDRAFT_729534 [Laetiporus sulphureus 93-53]